MQNFLAANFLLANTSDMLTTPVSHSAGVLSFLLAADLDSPMALSALAFVAVLVFGSVLGYKLYLKPHNNLLQLTDLPNPGMDADVGTRLKKSVSNLISGRLGKMIPLSDSASSTLRTELRTAGFREDSAVRVYSGIRILAAVGCLLIGLLCRNFSDNSTTRMLILASGLLAGLAAPRFILGRLGSRRLERIRQGLADALDLLVICCEAGCGLDQAINTVARDFKMVHPDLSDELSLVNMETLAGVNRITALRNLASRTGLEEVRRLVAILIQTDRFGTSIADALRTQADYMRSRRRQTAEERAGKVGVKLVFPIFFFFMPSLMVFVAGPGILSMIQMLKEVARSR